MTRNSHDFSLKSGERQFADQLRNIRGDHRARYSYGLDHITHAGFGLDLFCGNGYGSYMAAQAGHKVLSLDGSKEAIELANASYSMPGTIFSQKIWPFSLPQSQFDFCFCLESIEHVDDSRALLKEIAMSLRVDGILVMSTPNEDLMPFTPQQHKFHHRHYTVQETFSLLEDTGFKLLHWGGQNVYNIQADGTHELTTPNATVEPDVAGQFIITISQKTNRDSV